MRWLNMVFALVVVVALGELSQVRAQGCSGGSYGYSWAPTQGYYSPPASYGYYAPPQVSPWNYGFQGYQGPGVYEVPGYYQPQAWAPPRSYYSPYAGNCPGGGCYPGTRYRGVQVTGFRSR